MSESFVISQDSPAARLLIVDDETGIRSTLVRALSLLGYAVEGADCGQEALALLERTTFDLMVLDMQMPGMDGVEVMRRARGLQPELLIIVLTGHASIENAIAAVKLEAVDYLRKPAGIREIADTVAQVLERQAKQRQQRRLENVIVQALEALYQTETPSYSSPPPAEIPERRVHVCPLTLDCLKQEITVEGTPPQTVALTEGETVILSSLMTRPNQVLSCRELVRLARGQDIEETEAQSIVRPHISRLRRKIEAIIKTPRLICNVRKRGYYFAPIEE